jgi:hypothetical protein
MPQGVLPFEYQVEKTVTGMTCFAGLPVYLDLVQVFQLARSVRKHLRVRDKGQGYDDAQVVLALVLLNLSGGNVVEDIECLEKDRGFAELLKQVELHDLSRPERRELLHRWRKARTRTMPSPSAVFRYLDAFDDPDQEKLREASERKAFIPAPNEHLRGLARVNADLIAELQKRNPQSVATLDQDATLIRTFKSAALYGYKGYKAYQPLNVWWAEHGVMLYTEFRDGNVPADFDNLRVFLEALEMLPEGIREVYWRTDCAGYNVELMRYCDQGLHPRFGRIRFAISVPVEKEYKKAAAEVEALAADDPCPRGQVRKSQWKPLMRVVGKRWVPSGQEWAEVCFEPSWQNRSAKQRIQVRFFAIREPYEERALPGLEAEQQQKLPFPTVTMDGRTYKLFGMVTNRDDDPESIIRWHRERCGKSEEAHAVLKDDLAGGQLPSAKFGVNAAWWWIANLAMNLNTAMKRLVLATIDESWATKRMKAIRYHLIHVAGCVVEHARKLIVRLAQDHPAVGLLFRAREQIALLASAA